MPAVIKPRLTIREYLARERVAQNKNECYQGDVLAMSCGSPRHNTISGNLFAGLHGRLEKSLCQPFNSDQRIHVPMIGLWTYPDVSIVCGDLQFAIQGADSIINPRVVFEVLSKSTESYDRGRKFDMYRQLDSLYEYILVSQEEPQIERFLRQPDGTWVLTIIKGVDHTLSLSSVDVEIPLSSIYSRVTFEDESEARPGRE